MHGATCAWCATTCGGSMRSALPPKFEGSTACGSFSRSSWSCFWTTPIWSWSDWAAFRTSTRSLARAPGTLALSHVQSEAIARPRTRALRWTVAIARHEGALALLASALLVWTAQFHRLLDFGLYEDDYFFISSAMGQDPSYLLERLKVFATLPQGRPLGFFLPDLLSFVGDKLGGLIAIYVLGFAVITLNTFLCYRLLRIRVPVAPALVGAALFCLFPADTTKVLLTHDFQLQPALTFALLAGLAYAYDRKALAYVVAAGALLAYESGFLALFGLPLLVRRWYRSLARELARHVLILGAIVLLAVLTRFVLGEVRATQSVGSVADILPRLAGSLVLGPARSLAA